MSGSSFGNILKIQTFGESHGISQGVVIDGVPAGILLCEEDFVEDMDRRKPSNDKSSTTRKESDTVHILSGVFEGKTTGTPIALFINNEKINKETIFKTKEYLDMLKNRLLNNFETAFKFHNTSGESKYFKLCSFSDGTFENVSNLDLQLEIDAILTNEYSALDTEVINSIKNDIKLAIENECANIIDTENRVYLSTIIHDIAAKYSTYIRYMELNTINGTDAHKYNYIRYARGLVNTETPQSYIPEGISVPLSKINLVFH